MTCTVSIYYDAIGVAGTPSAGTNYLNSVYEIAVPDGDYIGELIAAGGGFGPCPSITQYVFRARNSSTGAIVGSVTSSTCHDIHFLRYENNCAPSGQELHDCINGTCVKNTQYGTPGLYKSLADCQAVCANGGGCGEGKQCVDPNTYCAPGKVCIDQSEFNEISGLVGVINGKFC